MFFLKSEKNEKCVFSNTVCDVIGCYGYDANTAAAAAHGAKGKDGSSAVGASYNK